jgi:Flp pilus assembly protein TadD
MSFFINHENRRKLILCLTLIVVTTAVYWQVKDYRFITFDDDDYVTENAYVRKGLTFKGLTWAFTTTHAHNWHPLTWLSHMLDVELFGLKPGWHHLMNLFFHVANTLLLFLILNRMTKALWQSAFVASLFALHPLHVESVAWVAERKDVLSTFFWMLTMGAYVYYVERPGIQRYPIVLLLFALGLMAKPMLVTLPFVLLLLDYWPLHRLQPVRHEEYFPAHAEKSKKTAKKKQQAIEKESSDTEAKKAFTDVRYFSWPYLKPLLREKTPLFLLIVLFSATTLYAQQRVMKPMELYPLGGRIANALISYVSYIGKMFWPEKLAIFYPYGNEGILSWQAAGAALLLLAITALTVWKARRYPYLVVGWLWYLGTLVPVIGLVQVGLQTMADRYTYVPLIGIFIMIAWGVPDLLAKWRYRSNALIVSATAIIAILTAVTWFQVQHWKNDITLYGHAAAVTSNNWWAHYNMGLSLSHEGKTNEALPHFQKTLRIKPNDPQAYLNIGIISAKNGNTEEAVSYFSRALQHKPDFDKAHLNLGKIFLDGGNLDKAFFHIQEANRIKPQSPETHFNLAKVYVRNGDLDNAIMHYLKALTLKPDYAEAHNNLGIALARKGKINEAIEHFREALWIKPGFREAYTNLQVALSQLQKSR